MSADWLRSRIFWHNVDAIAGGAGLLVLSALFWAASFFVVRWFLVWIGADIFGADWTVVSYWGAAGFLVVLLIDGYWNRHIALDVTRYAGDGAENRGKSLLMQDAHRGSWVWLYLLMNFFFAAPRTLLAGIAKLQGRVSPDDGLIARAAKILGVLYARRAWVDPARELPDQAAIALLEQLGLIWTEEQEGRRMIRWPAGKSLEEV